MDSDSLVIGLDLGTTRCQAVAVGPGVEVAASAASGYALHSPHPGWAEQSADEIWEGAHTALRGLAEQLPAANLAGLALSGAMHSVLLADALGQPLAPAPT